MKILMYHRWYGCDTGCCGHAVAWFADEFVPENDYDYYPDGPDKFDFDHADEKDKFEYAKAMVRKEFGEEHVKDLDFENSFIVAYDDCPNF